MNVIDKTLQKTGADRALQSASGKLDRAIEKAAKSAGAVGFFHKPVDAQALIDAIHWALDDPELYAYPQRAAQKKYP